MCKEITFNNLNELFSKVDYFLKDDSAREDISSLIYKIAIRNHTMRKRGMEILDVLKMKYNPILD